MSASIESIAGVECSVEATGIVITVAWKDSNRMPMELRCEGGTEEDVRSLASEIARMAGAPFSDWTGLDIGGDEPPEGWAFAETEPGDEA